MEIVPLWEASFDDWKQFVNTSDECWFFHRPEAQNLLDPAFQGFGLTQSGKWVGLCILYVRKLMGTRVLTYHTGSAGLALHSSVQNKTTYTFIENHLRLLAKKTGSSAIHLILSSLAPANFKKEFDESHLARLDFKEGFPWGNSLALIPAWTTIIDLSQTHAQIFRQFTKSAKSKCKQANKLEFTYRMIKDINAEEWQHFINNYRATFLRSKGVPWNTLKLEWVKQLAIKGFIKLIHFYDQEINVSSILLLIYKKRAFYFASGIQDSHCESGLSAFMQWIALQELSRLGVEWYEIGQSYPACLASTKLHSIGQFKRSFGGYKLPILAGTIVTSPFGYSTGLVLPRFLKKFLLPLKRRFL